MVIRRLLLGLGDAAGGCFALALAVSVFEVASRYLFDAPTSWAHVASTALCVSGFAIAGAYSMTLGEHLRVTLLIDRMRPGGRRACQWLALACAAVYLGGLGWGLGREAWQSVWRFDGFGNALRWVPETTPGPPNWPLPAIAKTMLLIGALLFTLAVLYAAWCLTTRCDPVAADDAALPGLDR